jgi:excisionase family DNA binding protein
VTFLPDRCYRARDVWRGGHVPRAMVYDALESGELRAVKRGRSFLIPGSAVLLWLEGLGR